MYRVCACFKVLPNLSSPVPFVNLIGRMIGAILQFSSLGSCTFSLALCIIFYMEAARGRPSDWKFDLSLLPFTLGIPVIITAISVAIPDIDYEFTCKLIPPPTRPKHTQHAHAREERREKREREERERCIVWGAH